VERGRLPPQPIDIQDIKKDEDLEEDVREGAAGSTRSEFPRCKDTPLKMVPSPTWNASEVQNKMIFMGHQISSCLVPVVRSFFI
jgi:hypothetical protein